MRIASLLLLASFGIPLAAHGFVVDVLTDGIDATPGDGVCATSGGHCTVRAAVMESNALAGRQTVTLGPGVHTLAILGRGENESVTGDLDVTDDLEIEGAGAAATELDAQGFDRILEVSNDANLTLGDLTIRNGFTIDAPGAGVRNASTGLLIAARVTFEGNHASGESSASIGGGVASDLGGTLLVFESELRGNSADRGGAVFANGQTLVLDSTLVQNVADRGSALLAYGSTTIERCTITDNEATRNGTIDFLDASAQLVNVTISGNQDPSSLLSTNALLQLTNVTIYDNVAHAALAVFPEGEARIANSVFVNPLATVECDTTPNSRGGNADRDGSCAVAESDRTVADPLLGPLADNGGPTRTHLPLAGSPLIDTGENDFCPALDQRLRARPIDGNANGSATCDIGAVEIPEPAALALALAAAASLAGVARVRRRGVARDGRRLEIASGARPAAACVALALLVLCAGSPARAFTRLAVSASGSVTAAPGGNPSMPIDTKDAYGPPPPSPLHAHVVATDSVPGASARMEAESTVGFGGFRGLATADASADLDFLGEAFAMVQASSNDEILIMPANLALVNSVATVRARILGSGNLEATNTGTPPPSPSQAGWSVTAQTDTGTTQGSVSGGINAASGPYGDPPGTYVLTFDVELGKLSQLAIVYVLMAETRYRFTDRTSGTGHAAARFGSTVTWGGIEEVLDAEGQPIAYSIDSASGTDWTQPVPEPGPAVLGLAVIATSSVLARWRS